MEENVRNTWIHFTHKKHLVDIRQSISSENGDHVKNLFFQYLCYSYLDFMLGSINSEMRFERS